MAEEDYNFLLPTVLLLATMLLIFGMKYVSNVWQARSRLANENSYRLLAEKATASQAASNASLATTQAELSDVKARLASIEKMLREVG